MIAVSRGGCFKKEGAETFLRIMDFSVDNIKKTGFYGYVYDFSVDYDDIAVDDVLGIYKYLMEKDGVV